jgi:glutathionylspermidine synthase
MQRRITEVRPDWQSAVESKGLLHHSVDGVPYWDESAYYEFTPAEVDAFESSTYELNRICLEAVQHIIDQDRFDQFLIPEDFRPYIRNSWEHDEHTVYGRFDLAYDGTNPPKMLEYNADTPTALLEAAVIQWFWLQDKFPGRNQFNSIHERLIEAWKAVKQTWTGDLHFAALGGHIEDFMTVNYLRDTAIQAGWETHYIDVEQIGWHANRQVFTDQREKAIANCFKLYPWEWMQKEKFGPMVLRDTTNWLEPPWKALLSNKAILAVLWELFPGHQNLLRAEFEPLATGSYVQKPILGREGANVSVFEGGNLRLATEGPYDGPVVYQQFCETSAFDGKHACIGSWIVNGWACGVGIREDDSIITGNLSRFVPHLFGQVS